MKTERMEPREIRIARSTYRSNSYQPTKAEFEREYDMPGAEMETLRSTFFKPLRTKRQDS